MGADVFTVCYGLRWEIDATDAKQVALLEERRDPRQLAARAHRLQCWWAGTVDERQFCVLVGHVVGTFGREGLSAARLTDDEAARVVAETRERLRCAGFADEPAWHYQFTPDR